MGANFSESFICKGAPIKHPPLPVPYLYKRPCLHPLPPKQQVFNHLKTHLNSNFIFFWSTSKIEGKMKYSSSGINNLYDTSKGEGGFVIDS